MEFYYEWYVGIKSQLEKSSDLLDTLENALICDLQHKYKDIEHYQKQLPGKKSNFFTKEVTDHLKNRLHNAYKYFPSLVFRNYIVFIYSILEFSVCSLCSSYDPEWKNTMKDRKGKSDLKKALLFLQKKLDCNDLIVQKRDLISLWNKVNAWREVRNAIVHELGDLRPHKRYKKISVLCLASDDENKVIIGVPECHSMLRDIGLFIDKIVEKVSTCHIVNGS